MSHAKRLATLTARVNSHANLSVAYSSGVDARVDRRTLLRKLIDERFGGSVAEFARAIGKSSSQVHQWLHGHRRLGDAGARHIEKTLPGLWQGYFDGDPPPSGLKYEQKEGVAPKAEGLPALRPQRDQVLVPIYDVSAAAGAGAFVEGEQVADHLLVRADWLRELVGYLPSSDKVAIIQVQGDSMEPTLSPGDLILVERRTYTREELTDGIYVVRLEGALLVKRLQFVPGGIALISDNERYERQVVSDVDVVARVIYAWRGKKM